MVRALRCLSQSRLNGVGPRRERWEHETSDGYVGDFPSKPAARHLARSCFLALGLAIITVCGRKLTHHTDSSDLHLRGFPRPD
jgi:hypothetical protein